MTTTISASTTPTTFSTTAVWGPTTVVQDGDLLNGGVNNGIVLDTDSTIIFNLNGQENCTILVDHGKTAGFAGVVGSVSDSTIKLEDNSTISLGLNGKNATDFTVQSETGNYTGLGLIDFNGNSAQVIIAANNFNSGVQFANSVAGDKLILDAANIIFHDIGTSTAPLKMTIEAKANSSNIFTGNIFLADPGGIKIAAGSNIELQSNNDTTKALTIKAPMMTDSDIVFSNSTEALILKAPIPYNTETVVPFLVSSLKVSGGPKQVQFTIKNDTGTATELPKQLAAGEHLDLTAHTGKVEITMDSVSYLHFAKDVELLGFTAQDVTPTGETPVLHDTM